MVRTRARSNDAVTPDHAEARRHTSGQPLALAVINTLSETPGQRCCDPRLLVARLSSNVVLERPEGMHDTAGGSGLDLSFEASRIGYRPVQI